MADHDESTLPEPAGKPVPDLIEQYRVRRDAWIAQADELARLRDEVRGSAEREAMEIVTSARKNVRQIVMEARRELLVLSAQVQAALGEASKQDPTALLNQGRDEADLEDGDERGTFLPAPSEMSDAVFAPEDAVKSMLDEARADMDALVEDARTVPFQAISPQPLTPAIMPPPPPTPPASPRAPMQAPIFASSMPAPMFGQSTLLSSAASRVLLSSPFPSEAVPVPAGRPLRTFIALFGLAGVAIVLGTVWWLRSPNVVSASPERAAESKASAPVAPAVATPAATTDPLAPAASAPSDLSLVVEARKPSWIRTTIDGESDDGRTFAAGETFRVTAERSVALRVGNAGAVYVSVNKGEALPLGREGQVVTRQFVVEGPKPAAPAPAAPAPTPIAPRPTPLPSVPTAKGPTTSPAPSPAPAQAPPIVQSVAAAPPPNTPTLDASPSPVNRGEPAAVTAPRAELTPPGPSSPQSAVLAASRQWLDAYHRQDRTAMAALSTDGLQLADERRNEERFPPASPVSRTLDKVSVQIAADTAVLTAVMTERSEDAAAPRVSPVSQVWVMSGGQWRVRSVRLVSEARLNQIFR
ncbi:MAG TPA: RodZ domain-containing protein [Vicinamibacterales bacterium]|nr:RodZ domain-containing protein [Vicinamibacterales bacterium]